MVLEQPLESRVDAIAAAVEATAGVVTLHPGRLGAVATYLAGRRVVGVRLVDGDSGPQTEVHIVVRQGIPMPQVADDIRAALASLTSGPVDVVIEDLQADDGPPPDQRPQSPVTTTRSPDDPVPHDPVTQHQPVSSHDSPASQDPGPRQP